MPLFSCGINSQTAPINIRERLAFSLSQTKFVLKDLCALKAVNEAVLVSTCNRTEVYMAGTEPRSIIEWFYHQANTAGINIEPHFYLHREIETVKHLLRVSSGLDSMVLGEPQILGQIKQSYQVACEIGAVKQHLRHLFPAIFAASKIIRNETQIGANPVSIAYAVVQTAKRIFSNLNHCSVLFIGAGELIELMVTHLRSQGVRQIMVANRDYDKAVNLAGSSELAFRMSEVPSCLSQADLVITATSSQLPIIGKGLVERTLKSGKRRPILMIDLAVPRDIEPEVSELSDIYLYNIDDLQAILEVNLKNRQLAAQQAEELVELQTVHYMKQLQVNSVGDVIAEFRNMAEQHRDQSLKKAIAELRHGKSPELVTSELAHQLTNKILHSPTVRLRQLAYNGQSEVVFLAKKLLTDPDEVPDESIHSV